MLPGLHARAAGRVRDLQHYASRKLNWTGPLWLAVIPAVAAQLTAAPSILTRRAWMTTVALACVIYPAFLIYLSFGLPGFGYSAKMELLPVGWSEMGFAVERLKREVQDADADRGRRHGSQFYRQRNRILRGGQAAAVRETTGSHLFGQGSLMFEFWTPPSSVEGASLLLVSFRRQELERTAIRKRCLRVGPITEHAITRNGKPICLYFTTVASGYRAPKRRAASIGLVPVGSRSVLGQSGSFDEMENKVRQARDVDASNSLRPSRAPPR